MLAIQICQREAIKCLLGTGNKDPGFEFNKCMSSPSFPSWLLPFLGPVITILLKASYLALVYSNSLQFISSRLQEFQTKLMLLQGWKLVSNVEHPKLDQVERDFCSARQAYAHAQQKEVTEERDLHPNSQEVS